MGIYLTKPSTAISIEIGEGGGLQFAVGEMQGWRKHMEDSHISTPELVVKDSTPISLFGVFDGHGGKEVAKFVKLKYPELLLGLQSFQAGDFEKALRESFHGIDRLLEDEQYDKLLKELRALPNPSDGKATAQKTITTVPTKATAPSPSPIIRAPSPDDSVDSKEDSDNDAPNSPPATDNVEGPLSSDEAVRMITELLEGARKYRKQHHLGGNSPNGEAVSPVTTIEPSSDSSRSTMPSSFMDDEEEGDEGEKELLLKPFSSVSLKQHSQSKESLSLAMHDKKDGTRGTTNSPVADSKNDSTGGLTRVLSKKEIDAEIKDELANEFEEENKEVLKIADSKEIILKVADDVKAITQYGEQAVENDEKGSHGSIDSKAVEAGAKTPLEIELTDDKSPIIHTNKVNAARTSPPNEEKKAGSKDDNAFTTPAPAPAPASVLSNGTLICNLKDHRVLAGCTAVVALVVGKKLYVANAGDSRGVMMRDGVAVALSEDHKPTQERELNRIKSAGGYVNVVGRVNGNLNLSRSLGDLKYKQLKHLPPEDQIITAEPDITVFDIQDNDEFFILACDGIWDCLTNQNACDLVKAGLQSGQSLEEITNDVLKRCLADDPRQSQGIGGDNMTFMVVQFKR